MHFSKVSLFQSVNRSISKLLPVLVFSLTVSACGDESRSEGESDNGTSISGQNSNEQNGNEQNGAVIRPDDTVNGFHLTGYKVYSEFDVIVTTSERRYDFDLNRIDIDLTQISFLSDIADEVTTSQEFFDSAGRITLREVPDGTQPYTDKYTFDENGSILTRITSGSKNETADFEYDANGRLIRVVRNFPDRASVKNFTYDATGKLVSTLLEKSSPDDASDFSNPETTTVTFTYNPQGQKIRREVIDSTVNSFTGTELFSYDENGNLVERIRQAEDFYDRTVFTYEASPKPVYNLWLRRFKYFP